MLHVERWDTAAAATPDDDRTLFPTSHKYVEILWTPFLGAMSVILLRRLTDIVSSDQTEVELADLAFAIGTRIPQDGTVGRTSPLARAFERLARFRLATWLPNDTLAVVTHVPALGHRDLARLPPNLGATHHRLLADLRQQQP